MGTGLKLPKDTYSHDRLGALNALARSQRLKKARQSQPLEGVSFNEVMHPEEYDTLTPSNIRDYTQRELAKQVGMVGLPLAFAAPAAMGGGLLARALTGAAINSASSLPMNAIDPEMADPLMDVTIGAGLGAAGIPGAAVGAVLGYSPEAEASLRKRLSRYLRGGLDQYAGGGMVRRGLELFGRRPMFEEGVEQAATLPGQLGVVKNRGGNWLPEAEETIGSLKKPIRGRSDAIWAHLPDELIERYRGESNAHGLVQKNHPKEWARARQSLQDPVDNWIEGPLTNYVKRELATPEDPVRALAEQGVLHFEPQWVPERPMERDRALNLNKPNWRQDPETGELFAPDNYVGPGARLGKSRLAQDWEDLSDSNVWPTPAGDLREYIEINPQFGADHPWIEKMAPDDLLHNLTNDAPSALGFDHLADELRNALNPESGLPRNLQLRPEQLQQMGMEKAVRHVDKINKWREAQKVTANQELASKAHVLREYPVEMNPKGLRWVELKAKNTPSNPPVDEADDAAQQVSKDDAYKELEAQLKYEGDTMGHCVGGYCDDVVSGKTRIFSLRDAKGEPHVTVEVGGTDYIDKIYNNHPEVLKDLQSRYSEAMTDADEDAWIREAYPELVEKYSGGTVIKQVKGKGNRKPKDEYLPFVQDFIKNSPLNTKLDVVGDLENTGLTHRSEVLDSTMLKALEDAGIPVPEYLTPEDISQFRKQ